MRHLLLLLLRLYHEGLSPWLGAHCRFYPSCSAYCREAILRYGLARGLLLGACRLLKCHPFSAGGYEPLTRNR